VTTLPRSLPVHGDGDGARMRAMRLAESREQHFTEGEPDIEPPEELCVSEVDDVALLEEELDNEDVLEQDVEEDVLEETLEDLVHHGDGDDDEDDGESAVPVGLLVTEQDEDEDVDVEGSDEVEEALDVVLEHRLVAFDERAGASPDGDDEDELPPENLVATNGSSEAVRPADEVRPCGPDEFTCRSCFLVRSRELLADEVAMTCRDCSE
jgi:uncharacterized protein DUF4193